MQTFGWLGNIREHTNWKKVFLNADFTQRLLWRWNFFWMHKYHFIQKQLPLRWVRSGCGVAAISQLSNVRLSTASQRSSSSYGGWLHGGWLVGNWNRPWSLVFDSGRGPNSFSSGWWSRNFLLNNLSCLAPRRTQPCWRQGTPVTNTTFILTILLGPKCYWDTVRIHIYSS